MGALEIEQFLGALAVKSNVAVNTQKTALNALVFLYKKFMCVELADLNFQYSSMPRNIPIVFLYREACTVIELQRIQSVCPRICSPIFKAPIGL